MRPIRPEILRDRNQGGGRELKTLGMDFALSEVALLGQSKNPRRGEDWVGERKGRIEAGKACNGCDGTRTVFESTFHSRLNMALKKVVSKGQLRG